MNEKLESCRKASFLIEVAFVGRFDYNVKATDKGGAVVVWRADLYQKEASRPLSDTSFYDKVDKDLTLINQTIVKNTIYDLIAKQELPATAKNLTITTPRTSSIYFLPKIHRPNNPGRPIVSVCSCPTEVISSYLDKIMAPIVKTLPSYIKDSQHELEIFRYFSILGQNSLFSPEILHIFILSFLKTKVPGPSNNFSILAPLRNLALKHYSVWPIYYSHSIAFRSVVITTNKLMAWPWVLKWNPATPNFS